jgi:hypothetical protein
MLSVTFKPYMLSIIMQNVIMLSVVAPYDQVAILSNSSLPNGAVPFRQKTTDLMIIYLVVATLMVIWKFAIQQIVYWSNASLPSEATPFRQRTIDRLTILLVVATLWSLGKVAHSANCQLV